MWMINITTLKATKTHISSYFYSKVLIIYINQWKFEQNRAKSKKVKAFSNLVNSRGRWSNYGDSCGQLSIHFVHRISLF